MSIDSQPFMQHNAEMVFETPNCKCIGCTNPADIPHDYCKHCWNSCQKHIKESYEIWNFMKDELD